MKRIKTRRSQGFLSCCFIFRLQRHFVQQRIPSSLSEMHLRPFSKHYFLILCVRFVKNLIYLFFNLYTVCKKTSCFQHHSSSLRTFLFQYFTLYSTEMNCCNSKIRSNIMLRNSFDDLRLLLSQVNIPLLWSVFYK